MKFTPYQVAALKTEMKEIEKAIKFCHGNKSEAAKLLQIDRKTIYNKINMYKKWQLQQSLIDSISKAKAPQ